MLIHWFRSTNAPWPMRTSVLLAKKTLILYFYNGKLVLFIDIGALELVLLFPMGALSTNAYLWWRCIDAIFKVWTHQCSVTCVPHWDFGQKTSMFHFCNGTLALLFGNGISTMVPLLGMGAPMTDSPLWWRNASVPQVGVGTLMLHDPCDLVCFWPKNIDASLVKVHQPRCSSLIKVHQHWCFWWTKHWTISCIFKNLLKAVLHVPCEPMCVWPKNMGAPLWWRHTGISAPLWLRCSTDFDDSDKQKYQTISHIFLTRRKKRKFLNFWKKQ